MREQAALRWQQQVGFLPAQNRLPKVKSARNPKRWTIASAGVRGSSPSDISNRFHYHPALRTAYQFDADPIRPLISIGGLQPDQPNDRASVVALFEDDESFIEFKHRLGILFKHQKCVRIKPAALKR